MPRKLRFYQRKRERQRIPKKLIVSVDTHGIQLPSFKMSIPLDKVVLSSPHMLSQLYENILGADSLFSTNWTVSFLIEQLICQKHLFVIKIPVSLKWSLQYQCFIVYNNSCILLSEISPVIYNVGALLTLLNKIDGAHICIGNPDPSYLALAHKGKFLDQPGKEIVAVIDDKGDQPTVRHVNCEVLVSNNARCKICATHRRSLSSQLVQHSQRRTHEVSLVSHTNNRYLQSPELRIKLSLHQKCRRNMQKKISRLKDKLQVVANQKGVLLDDADHNDFKELLISESANITKKYHKDSFEYLFWEQQMKAAQCKDARQMRWHPVIIKWCLYLRNKSSGMYEALRDSGCISLPSQRTLRDYTHCFDAKIGFSDDVDRMLMDVAKLSSCEEYQKYVGILIDEMHIREELIYSKHKGCLSGFANLGNINEQLLKFEKILNDTGTESTSVDNVAKTMMVFMVKGLFTSLAFPYVFFPCATVSGDMLHKPLWDCIFRLERCGFKVLFVTADGASTNRFLFKMHDTSESLLYKVKNKYASEYREVFFFSDPPHLIKTTRNCWASKHKHLMRNDKAISWKHLEDLYIQDSKESSKGARLVPKLKYEHIYLTPFSKMRVDLAAQVLSGTVANALLMTHKDAVTETAKFAQMFDHFFDCLNVLNLTEGTFSRKCFQLPYRSKHDFRIEWMKDDFLPYLDEVGKIDIGSEDESCDIVEDCTTKEKQKRQAERRKQLAKKKLSKETYHGIRMTAYSFIEMIDYIFTIPHVTVFLSGKINQDPLEKFFGIVRQKGHGSENPNVEEFCKTAQTIRVANSVCASVHIKHGNCRGQKSNRNLVEEIKDPVPLQKRKRHK